MDPGNEVVITVDEQNRETGKISRRQMRVRKLIHRASYILVFNRAGELFLQKRTAAKDIYPSHYDVAAGGVVLAGESYEESARRELHEELGLEVADLQYLFDHFYRDADNAVWGRVFCCVHDGPFVLQAEEIESGEFKPIAEVLDRSRTAPFTPDGVEILRKYAERKQNDTKENEK